MDAEPQIIYLPVTGPPPRHFLILNEDGTAVLKLPWKKVPLNIPYTLDSLKEIRAAASEIVHDYFSDYKITCEQISIRGWYPPEKSRSLDLSLHVIMQEKDAPQP